MTFHIVKNFSEFLERSRLWSSQNKVRVKRKKREAWADTTPEEKVRTIAKHRSYD
jgi:hypothetical protein